MAAAALLGAAPLGAQQVRLGVALAGTSLHNGAARSRSTGIGFGASAQARRGRLRLGLDLSRTPLSPDDSTRGDFTLTHVGARLAYRVRPGLDGELGVFRYSVSPTFATPDVGAVSLGLRSERALSDVGGIWVRAGVLALVHYNSGGTTGSAFEAGFGTWVGRPGGRLRLEFDYSLDRLDRSVPTGPLPLQRGVTRLGASIQL